MSKIELLNGGFVRLVDHMGDDSSIVQMARVSYGDGTKKVSEDRGLIRYLMRNRHTTPFEGVIFKFHIKAPIFVFRQWHRHRTWSYNEMSGRYSVLPDECYVPEEDKVTTQNPTNKQGGTDEVITPFNIKNPADFWDVLTAEQVAPTWKWSEYFEGDQKLMRDSYERYVGSGMRREVARINLPVSQYSEMYAVVDLHNLFHFLKLRMDSHAQYEIRVYANAIAELIKGVVPVAYEAFDDYILNGTHFTKLDMRCAYELFDLIKNSIPEKGQDVWNNDDIQESIDQYATRIFPNKRERSEAIKKMQDIFLYTPDKS